MLGQRIVTAVVLLALLLPALFAASPWPFALVTLVLIGAAGWEWSRLNGMPGTSLSILFGSLLAAAGLAAASAGWVASTPAALWWWTALLWLIGGAWVLHRGAGGWQHWPRWPRIAIGFVLLWLAWLALAQARHVGINFVLSVMALVWVADIAAYAGGRLLGRHKLAPSISPGKTWEGVGAGMAGVLLLALGWTWIESRAGFDSPSLAATLQRSLGDAGAVAALLVLAGMSVMGDLFESLVKRAAGVKDSSALLPGHGGVLDRIDALLPVFPAAVALATLG